MTWTKNNQEALDQVLDDLCSEKYQKFHSGLGVDKVLGVTIPNLESASKALISLGKAMDYLDGYVSCHYEGDVIYGMLIGYVKIEDDARKKYIRHFCELIDNWATCDYAIARWKFVRKHPETYLALIHELIASKKEWHCRVAYVMLLDHYLNDHDYMEVIRCLEKPILPAYYTEMAAAWLISMGLVKYPDVFEAWLISANISPFVYQKSLQKAIESRRISLEKKEKYRQLKKQLMVE